MNYTKKRERVEDKVLRLLNDNIKGIRRSLRPGVQMYLILNAHIKLGDNEKVISDIARDWADRNGILYLDQNFLGEV